ncbi:MAG: transglutaminase-like domain-containing protein [Planctomycetes bacterium]|nr:transglutaminase-like domain-containing protein [Planctomycetota bacterium]
MRVHPFDLLMELSTDHIRLDCAALHLARDVYPELDINVYLTLLDCIAQEVADLRPGLTAPLRYEAMREVLVANYGLSGSIEDYLDPQGSYLNRVLKRRTGIPVALSVVWLEVARRLKWPVAGVALPGYFLVRFDDAERFVLADPFDGGVAVSVNDCRRVIEQRFRGQVSFSRRMLRQVDTRTVLTRVLTDLRALYLARREWPRVALVLRRLAAVEPDNVHHLQDLAALHCRRGDVRAAYAHLAVCLERLPAGDDRKRVRQNLHKLQAAVVALN